MLNFIICDDESTIRKNVLNIVSKIMMPVDMEYKTYEFDSYGQDFEKITKKKMGKRIYILDVEVNKKSGLDAIRMIREKDWESIIIVLTVHYELAYEAFKSRLLLLDFISKFDDYENKLYTSLTLAINISCSTDTLNFVFDRTAHKVVFDDILYISTDDTTRRIVIKTFYEKYRSAMTLTEIEKKLNFNFCRTHRACIVNYQNVKCFDFKNGEIIFKNNEKINFLSKNYKKGVKKICM